MKKLIIANWKMQLGVGESLSLVKDLVKNGPYYHDLIICPDFLSLDSVSPLLVNTNIKIAAQNCAREKRGALTGEVSALNLKEIGVEYVIIGHSERRSILKEDKATIRAKVQVALEAGLKVILCVGENVMERKAGRTRPVIASQTRKALSGLKIKKSDLIIAYEPVWAIGSGKYLAPEEINKALQYVEAVAYKVCDKKFETIYGGSVNLENAKSILKEKNINGLLVGGASLKFEALNSLLKI